MTLLLENWREQKHVFINNLQVIRDRPTKKSIHDLRVSVKKIRSYLRLSEKITGGKWKHSFLQTRAFYRSGGRVSDLDASLTLINKKLKTEILLTCFKEYLSVNRNVTRKWTKHDAAVFKKAHLDSLGDYLKLELTNTEMTQKIIQFSKQKIKTVKELSDHFEKNLHKIRKLLKDVCNWVKIGEKELIDDFINIKALDNMLTHLGNWQDQFVLLHKAKQYKKEFVIDKKEKEILAELEKELITRQKKELDAAIKKWNNVEVKSD